MAKAPSGSITASTPRANGTIDLSDWIEPGKARITLRSSSGQILVYTVTTAMFVQSVNMAVELINTNVFRVRMRFAPPSLLAEHPSSSFARHTACRKSAKSLDNGIEVR